MAGFPAFFAVLWSVVSLHTNETRLSLVIEFFAVGVRYLAHSLPVKIAAWNA